MNVRRYDYATDGRPLVAEGPAYPILIGAAHFAAYFLDQIDFSDIAPECHASVWAEAFDFAVSHFLDERIAQTFWYWREVFTPRVVSLN
jgi:hypothetical protein